MLKFRKANISDVDIIFNWANDPVVRKLSYNSEPIEYSKHVEWFNNKLNDNDSVFYVFENNTNEPIGLVRIEKSDNEIIIGVSVDEKQRGKSYASKMLKLAADAYQSKNKKDIHAYIKKDNFASIKSFENAGFVFVKELLIKEIPSVLYVR